MVYFWEYQKLSIPFGKIIFFFPCMLKILSSFLELSDNNTQNYHVSIIYYNAALEITQKQGTKQTDRSI